MATLHCEHILGSRIEEMRSRVFLGGTIVHMLHFLCRDIFRYFSLHASAYALQKKILALSPAFGSWISMHSVAPSTGDCVLWALVAFSVVIQTTTEQMVSQ